MGMKGIDRRGALGILASGAAALALESAPALAQYGVRVREDITTFQANATKIAALRNGVKVMQDRSTANQNDPTGWYYWASVHGTIDPVPPALVGIYNSCQHGTVYFEPWHRAFLYYFEQTLRAASGDATLNLPYWDWYNTPTIPSSFTATTTPTSAANPLWHARANNTTSGLSQAAFAASITNFKLPPSPGFSGSLEGNPHGTVHGEIGGDMGIVPTAGRDPIFWLHHCNIDRLWNVWLKLGGGRANPGAADPWSNQPFTYDVGGTMTKKAGQVVDSAAMLNYKYDRDTLSKPVFPWWKYILAYQLVAIPIPRPLPPYLLEKPRAMANMAMVERRVAVQAVSALPDKNIALGSKSARMLFPLSPASQARLQAFAARPAQRPGGDISDVTLVLEGVQLSAQGRNGGFSYAVCVALPAGTLDQATFDRACVGTLNSFTLSVEAQHNGDVAIRDAGYTVRIPLGAAFANLKPEQFREGVPVTFLAQHETLDAGKGPRTYITIKGAHLEFEQGQ